MRHVRFLLHVRWHAALIALGCSAALVAAFACNSASSDVHDSDQAKNTPCITCHAGAYNVASNPVHVGQMPQTCETCHDTTAWSPSAATSHPWWPLQNKHVGPSCNACHTKGFKVGDTSRECVSCHQKDADSLKAPAPVHDGFFPKKCELCHTDSGFAGSTFNHDFWLLEGKHSYRVTPCAACHDGGSPETWKFTPKDCYTCHTSDFDKLAPTKNPSHPTFPHTCLDCHVMSGWTQGPPLGGLHPDAKFPRNATSQPGVANYHAVACLDCHKLEKGLAAGGANTDCTNCHVATPTYDAGAHDRPAIDLVHQNAADGGVRTDYANAIANSGGSTNFCLGCHPQGQHL